MDSAQGHHQADHNEVKETESAANQEIIRAFDGIWLLQCNGYWYPKAANEGLIYFQRNFKAKDGDILLASMPKCGTTWLKALVFSIVNRDVYPPHLSPLLTSNPHQLVPSEFLLGPGIRVGEGENIVNINVDHPKIFGTHLPYNGLPGSIVDSSSCKIVYVCRNPLDQFISLWHFYQNLWETNKALPLELAFESFVEGKHPFGPFWNHMLGYWDASMKGTSDKLLFLKYEDLKDDTVSNVKKIAKFLGYPFSEEEEENGKIEEITQLCSIQSLKSMEVNKTGKLYDKLPINNSSYFRKGEVGDWANYLSPFMANRVEKLMIEKFGQSGLTFDP